MLRRGCRALLIAPVLLFCLGSECDLAEPEDNFVTVHVTLRANIVVALAATHTQIEWEGAQIQLEIVKAGGEREEVLAHTDGAGAVGPLAATFKVYREQPVDVYARVVGGIMPAELGEDPWDPLLYTAFNGWAELEWHRIQHLMGGEYYWHPELDVVVRPKQP